MTDHKAQLFFIKYC